MSSWVAPLATKLTVRYLRKGPAWYLTCEAPAAVDLTVAVVRPAMFVSGTTSGAT